MRDLYEALLQRDAVAEPLFSHRLVRKNNRSPSLRLRFGRRSDPAMLQVTTAITSVCGFYFKEDKKEDGINFLDIAFFTVSLRCKLV